MANRIQKILDKARHQLADPHKSRWTDEVLLSLLSEGQQDLANQALLLKKWVDLPVFVGQSTYKLPEDFIKLESAYILDEHKTLLKYMSYQDLDKRKKGWTDEVGTPKYIVYDIARNSSEFVIYPAPDKETEDASWLFDTEEPYGVITKADGVTISGAYGTIISSNVKDVEVSSYYGIVTNILEIANYLRLYYHYKPADLTSVDDELTIMPAMDKALKHYVVAQALRNDMDSMNIKVANDEMQFYALELREIISDSSKDYQYEKEPLLQSKYDGGF